LVLALLAMGCAESRNLGSSVPHGLLPVDERNPILLANDGVTDNWQGEYAVLLANGGGPKLAGIIVNTSGPWPNLDTNMPAGVGWPRPPRRAASATFRIRDPARDLSSRGRQAVRSRTPSRTGPRART
jgi:hypothetical protein